MSMLVYMKSSFSLNSIDTVFLKIYLPSDVAGAGRVAEEAAKRQRLRIFAQSGSVGHCGSRSTLELPRSFFICYNMIGDVAASVSFRIPC